MRFVCIQNCFTNHLVVRGQIVDFENEESINKAVRPFFRPLKATDKVVKTSGGESSDDEKPLDEMTRDELLVEAEKAGAAVDRRWSKSKILIEIKKKIQGF